MKMCLRQTPIDERDKRVLRLRSEEGLTYAKIGKMLGISHERVRQILSGAKTRMKENEKDPDGFALLPNRVRWNLLRLGYRSRTQVLADIRSGKLWWEKYWRNPLLWDRKKKESRKPGTNLARVRNFGRGCWRILCEWLGLPAPETELEITRPQKGAKVRR